MRACLAMAVLLVTAVPVSAQVVGQGSPATTSDAASWPIKVVFGDAQVDPRARTWTLGGTTDSIDVTRFGGNNIATGRGPSGSGIPRVTGSTENITGSVSVTDDTGSTPCPAASATAATTSASCVVIPLAGSTGAGFGLATGTLAGTIEWDFSDDGGTTWDNSGVAIAIVNGNQDFDGIAVTNPNVGVTGLFIVSSHWTHVRVYASAFTSGAATLTVNATNLVTPLAVGAITAGVSSAAFVAGMPLFVNMAGLRVQTATPAAATATQPAPLTGDVYGVPYMRQDHPARFRCTVTVSTATTIQAVGGSCAAPGASLSLYITDIHFATSAAAGTAADSFPTLKYGTGGTCGTGTVVFWGALTTANSTVVNNLSTPIKIPANNEVCWIMTTAGSKFIVLEGYIAP